MKNVLYIIRRPPGPLADETTDLMLVSGVFEQPASALFLGDGVWQLVGLADRRSSVKALATYGVEALHVDGEALAARGLTSADLGLPAEVVDADGTRALIAGHELVVAD